MRYSDILKKYVGYDCDVIENSFFVEVKLNENRQENINDEWEPKSKFDKKVTFKIQEIGDDFISFKTYLEGVIICKSFILPLNLINLKVF